ncbi:MAG: LacI family DNA-binding transcriptional regulator [Lentisphaeria bacterium]|nr:LacI family DNA-binding transcriptional regulator [Lentisphaeria bacterium]
MGRARCTLQDIADRCGVSTAVVSTVVNNRQSRIACAQKTREKILAAADKLNYVPNILARSMRKKRIPLVGVFLHTNPDDMMFNYYVGNTLASCAGVLNKYSYETIFVPYSNSSDQYERMSSLISMGFVGGIITNIIQNDSERICTLLNSSSLPYTILGKVKDEKSCCLYNSNTFVTEQCLNFMRKKNLKRCISVELSFRDKNQFIFRQLPFPENYIWNAPELDINDALFDTDSTFYVFMGIKLYNKLCEIKNCKHFLIHETINQKENIPQNFNMILEHPSDILAENLEKTFCRWLVNDEKPSKFHTAIERPSEIFEVHFPTLS